MENKQKSCKENCVWIDLAFVFSLLVLPGTFLLHANNNYDTD